MCNFIFLEELTEPLQHLPSIFVIHLPNQYVTIVVDGEKYYFYDSLLPKSKVRVPRMVNSVTTIVTPYAISFVRSENLQTLTIP